jgi:hypothetical protein
MEEKAKHSTRTALNNLMAEYLSWTVNDNAISYETVRFYGIGRFLSMFRRARHCLLVGWLVRFIPAVPILKHRASVKRFVSLQFLNLRHSVALLGRVITPSQGRYLTQTDIHASSGIRTHDSRVRASEDGSCLRPRGRPCRSSSG